MNNRVLDKISETQPYNHEEQFAATAMSGGYKTPKFKRNAEAYGIRAVKLLNYEEL